MMQIKEQFCIFVNNSVLITVIVRLLTDKQNRKKPKHCS